jgi:peroxiredoxin
MKTMFKVSILIIAIVILTRTQAQNSKGSFVIEGNITGQNSGRIILNYGYGAEFNADTASITNGAFSFHGTVNEPTRGMFIGEDRSNRGEIYIESGKLKVVLSKDKFSEVKLTGSASQRELDNLNKKLISAHNKDSVTMDFILKNPHSYLSPYYLTLMHLSEDTLKRIYNGFSASIQESRWGKRVKGEINQKRNTKIGETATDFAAKDMNGNTITLSQFKGKKIVLLEFWASWCVKCREGFPHIKKLYEKYYPMGFEVIAIAGFDNDVASWVSAIKEDNIDRWYHVPTVFRNGQTINEQIALDYPLNPIPRSILIDKNGKVIGHWSGNNAKNKEALEGELKRIFGS